MGQEGSHQLFIEEEAMSKRRPYGSRFRMCNSPLKADPIQRDLSDPVVMRSFDATHTTMAPEEVARLFAEAVEKRRLGSHFEPLRTEISCSRYFRIV